MLFTHKCRRILPHKLPSFRIAKQGYELFCKSRYVLRFYTISRLPFINEIAATTNIRYNRRQPA